MLLKQILFLCLYFMYENLHFIFFLKLKYRLLCSYSRPEGGGSAPERWIIVTQSPERLDDCLYFNNAVARFKNCKY